MLDTLRFFFRGGTHINKAIKSDIAFPSCPTEVTLFVLDVLANSWLSMHIHTILQLVWQILSALCEAMSIRR